MKRIILYYVVAGLLSGLASGSALAHSAIEAVPRNEANWKDRHEAIKKKVAEAGEKGQVIFVGDSITQGWEGAGKEVWSRYYAPRSAVNLGIGGDRTQHVLWRLKNGALEGLTPKAAVVMIGTNNSNSEDNAPGQIVEGVAAIVDKLRQKLPQVKILLLAIFPRSENYSQQRGKLAMINQVLAKLADERHVFWIDLAPKFLNPDGTLPRDLMPDYLHLSPKGYEIWAQSIEERLNFILGGDRASSATNPGSSLGSATLTGEWIWTIQGPDGNPLEAPMILKQEGDRVTGQFARGQDRWLEIEEGKLNGQSFTWTVKRDRPGGGTLAYRMSGKLEEGKIIGQTKTDLDGNELTVDWSAKRK